MKIKKKRTIKLHNKVPVYDIEVETFHNFKLKDGPYVHNSKDVADAVGQLVYNCHVNMKFHDDSLLPSTITNSSENKEETIESILEDFENYVKGIKTKIAR